jgi:hypothetical protein
MRSLQLTRFSERAHEEIRLEMIEGIIKCKLSSEVAFLRLVISSVPDQYEKAYFRITNTLQELNLLIQLITLFDKPRFSKEPSYSSAHYLFPIQATYPDDEESGIR